MLEVPRVKLASPASDMTFNGAYDHFCFESKSLACAMLVLNLGDTLSTHEAYVLIRDWICFAPALPVWFVQGNNGYDVIIVDSSDPVGPAESLFQPVFYQVR